MRKSSLKKKLQRRELTIGSWITIGNEIVAEVMAKAGFDWLVIDMEHSAIDLSCAQNLVRVVELCGSIPLVRVGNNDLYSIKRVMDSGAYGIIVPMVNSAVEAERAVMATRYPPSGKRGVGLARAQGYGISFDEYKRWLQNESVVIVQIEHVQAVRDLKNILQVKGVDAFMVGPYDITGSMGHPGEFKHPEYKKIIASIMKQSRELKTIAGIHVIPPDPAEAVRRIKEGFKFIALSLDSLILARSCEGMIRKFKRGTNAR